MSNWDDKPTVIGFGTKRPTVAKGSALNAAQRAGTVTSTTAKGRAQAGGATNYQKLGKLDADDAPKPPEKVDISVGKALAAARMAKKNADGKSMTQKELATAANAKPQDIADLESGRALPNQQLLGKLERIVGVKLRGAASQIGQPLHGPKKK